jgi:formylglycine-generating enzyme required for sulfatase activity/serine/threonine protein kinase
MVEESMLRCSCGEPLEPDWDECPACLKPIVKEQLNCPKCGRNVKAKWKKCPKCKTPLDGWATPTQTSDTGTSVEDSSSPASIVDDGPYLSLKEGEDDNLGYGVEVIINEGDVLDKYIIQGTLGTGGFGSVYLAYDTVLKEKVALKVVVAGESDKAQNAREQIIHEFKFRKKITDSSHIVTAGDPRTCEHKNVTLVLLPMDFAEGGSFRDWLKKNKSEEARTKEGLKIFRQACLGVKAIHDEELSHLDIKPENILLVDGMAKIADFGIGRYGANLLVDNPKQIERQGIGTPQYMSPEQFHSARQKDIGPASDIYSLGVVLYELLDGSSPFDGPSYDEYRQRHLHESPTEIKGACAKYWGIVARCLAKKADDRYESVEQLIGDLDRVAQGASLSVDVSCPECGHINSDTTSDRCKKCGSDLPETLFRECHHCMKKLRLDTEICPGCGFHVLEYYVLQDRWQRIQKFKDEDPVEAIELLEMALCDGVAEHEEKALALVRDLRKKQSQIRDLIAEADKAMADGKPEKALENWRAVLDVIPRHRVALEQIEKLESLIKNFADLLDEAEKLMDQAKFEDADANLRTCLQLIPQREKPRNMLRTCRQQAKAYNTAFSEATMSMKHRLLRTAEQQVKAALAQAPNSPAAMAMAVELSETFERTEQLIEQAHRQLSRAEFGIVSESIREIEQRQADSETASELKIQLNEIQHAYSILMENAKLAENAHDLGKAVQAAEQALKFCPQAPEAKSLLKRVKEDQKKAQNLLEELTLLLRAARFEDAEALVKQVEKLWTTIEGLKETKDTLITKCADYIKHMQSSQRAKTQGMLEQALRESELALTVCSESPEAKTSVKSLRERKGRAYRLFYEAVAATKAALFEEADTNLSQADTLWPHSEDIIKARADLARCREDFPHLMLAARGAEAEKDLEKALQAVETAISICLASKEALALAESIRCAQSEAEKHLKKARTACKTDDFETARSEINQAEKIWPRFPGLGEAVKSLLEAKRARRQRIIVGTIVASILLGLAYGIPRILITRINQQHANNVVALANRGQYSAAVVEYYKYCDIPPMVSRAKLPANVMIAIETADRQRQEALRSALDQSEKMLSESRFQEAESSAKEALSLACTYEEKRNINATLAAISGAQAKARHDEWLAKAQEEILLTNKIKLLRKALSYKHVGSTYQLLQAAITEQNRRPKTGDTITNSIDMKLVYVPQGEFIMGSSKGRDEGPPHKVTISKGFYMGVCEVTQGQYKAVMGSNPSGHTKFLMGGRLPVERISWDEATAFCNRLGRREGKTYRLPTEAEWEYACRAGSATRFSFGNGSVLSEYAWYQGNSGGETHAVGQKKPNAFGLYDMHGNVAEWCSDWYDDRYPSADDQVDPPGPKTGSFRVLRGGFYNCGPTDCHSTVRRYGPSDDKTYDSGFRVVLNAE